MLILDLLLLIVVSTLPSPTMTTPFGVIGLGFILVAVWNLILILVQRCRHLKPRDVATVFFVVVCIGTPWLSFLSTQLYGSVPHLESPEDFFTLSVIGVVVSFAVFFASMRLRLTLRGKIAGDIRIDDHDA